MGKYIIRVENVDNNEQLDRRYQDGIECDGFVILADKGEGCETAIHNVNVDIISDMIAGSSSVLAAGVLAKGKRDAADIVKKGKAGDMLEALMAGMR